jgi:hypothetical protein
MSFFPFFFFWALVPCTFFPFCLVFFVLLYVIFFHLIEKKKKIGGSPADSVKKKYNSKKKTKASWLSSCARSVVYLKSLKTEDALVDQEHSLLFLLSFFFHSFIGTDNRALPLINHGIYLNAVLFRNCSRLFAPTGMLLLSTKCY